MPAESPPTDWTHISHSEAPLFVCSYKAARLAKWSDVRLGVVDLGSVLARSSHISHTGDFKIGTRVAALSGTWRYKVSAGAGLPGVNIL